MTTYERKAPATPQADDLDPRPGIAWPAGSVWWDELLPTRPDPASDGIRYTGWWNRDRTLALMSWLGDGAVRDLALALTGTTRRRQDYATSRSHSRWVADVLMSRTQGDAVRSASQLLAAGLPPDRQARAKVAADRLEHVADLVPALPPGADPARWVFRHLHLVQAVSHCHLWPPLGDPSCLRTGIEVNGRPQTLTILPGNRRQIDLDARMEQAVGVFG